jgi:outer membrane receptor protein involved in Fe transport
MVIKRAIQQLCIINQTYLYGMPAIHRLLRLLLLMGSSLSFAQHTIIGKIQSNAGQPLAFANVLLVNAADSSLVKGAVATEAGLFSIESIKSGQYLVTATMIGYRDTYSAPFFLKDEEGTYQLATLMANTLDNQLNEVTVIAKKPVFEQQLDKLVINPSAMITAAGSSVLDILERLPSVRVDRQNGAISLGGKSGVMVMLNGKLSRLPLETLVQMLSGMNADNVETIELIANPSARYDAEGNAGLINIVLKRKQGEGTNGIVALMAGYGRFEKGSTSLSLNHNQGWVNWFGNASYLYDRNWFDFLPIRTQQVNQELWENRQYSDRFPVNQNGDFRIGADVSLSTRTVLSAQVQGILNKRNVVSYNTSNTRILGQGQPFTESALTWVEDSPWRNIGGSIGLSHTTKLQHTFTVDADYQWYANNSLSTFDITRFSTTNPTVLPIQSLSTSRMTTIQFGVLRADYSRSLGKQWKMESGIKLNLSGIDNNLLAERITDGKIETLADFTSQAVFKETIVAAYTHFSGQLGPKTDFQGGLRAENTHTIIASAEGTPLLNRRYLNLFPTASFKHALSDQHTLHLAYSRRLTRPIFNELIPNFYITDPNTYYVGNITLKPAYINTVKVGYSFQGACFVWLGYSHEKDVINKHQPVTYPGRPELIHITQNFDRAEVVSLEFSFPITFRSWWEVQNNLSGYYRSARSKFDIGPFSQQMYYGNLSTVHTFSLGKRWTAEMSAVYLSLIPAGVMNLRSRTNVSAGIQKVLPNQKGTLRLTVNDLFWTNTLRWYVPVTIQQFDFQAKMKFEPRVAKLTYSRNFGNQKVKAARKRRVADEEKGRVTF